MPHGDVFSSIPFQTQPLVQAQDDGSIVDIHFADQVTLSTAAAGQLTGTTRIAAIDGIARFTDVAYRASADQESFQLTADDETGGAEGDLPPLILSTTTADVVATRAVFITQPAQTGLPDGTVVHALPFDIQPVLEAQDSSGVRDRHLNAGGVFLSVSSGEATLTGQAAEAWNAGRADFFGNGLTLRVTGDSERVVLEAESDIGLSATFSDPLSVDIRATRLVFLQGPRTVGTAAAELVDASIQVAAVYQDGRVDEEFVNPITVTAVLPGTDTPASGALTIAPAQVQIPIDGLATFSSVIYQEAGSIQLRAASPGVEVARSDTIRLTGNLTLDTPSSQLENQLAHSRGIVPARLPLVALEATAADEQLILRRLEVVLEPGNGLQLEHIGGLQLWRDRGAPRVLDDADQLLAVALVGESLVTFTAVGDTLSNTGRYLITWDGRVALQKDWTIRGRVHPEGMTVSSTQAPAITAVPVFGTTISGPLHAVGDLGLPHRVRLSAAPDTLTADGLSRSTLTATIVDALDQPIVYDDASIVSFATLNGSALIDGPVAVQVESGRATTALLTGTSPGLVQIRAGVPGLLADTLNIALVAGSVTSIELGAVPSVLHLNQTDRIDLSATLRDARGNPVAHSPERIRLSISGSGFFAENLPSQIVDIAVLNGVARTTIEATQPGTLQVQASIDGISADLAIPVISTQPPHIILNADILSIPADGSGPARLTASLLDSRGQLMAAADSVQVSFSIGSGHGLFLTPSIVPARQGRASIDVQALGIAGPIIVRAEAPDLEAAELTLSARAAAAHHLDLVALTPGITADGLSTTLLSAVVRDTLNNLVTDADVEILFSIIDGRAEIIGPLTVPALEGIARTTLRASIRAGSVELLATAAGLLPGRTSVKLLAGRPAKLALSAIPSALPASGGATSELTAIIQDTHGNKVLDDSTTLISFSVSGGPGLIGGPAFTRATAGEAHAILQASGLPGKILVFAGATELTAATFEIAVHQAQPPFFIALPDSLQLIEDGDPIRFPLDSLVGDADTAVEDLTFLFAPDSLHFHAAVDAGELVLEPNEVDYSGAQIMHLTVRDPTDLEISARILVDVLPVNDAPLITSIPDTLAVADSLYIYRLTAMDVDGDPLHFSLLQGPQGLGFDRVLQRAAWREPSPGIHTLRFEVSDGQLQTEQFFRLRVLSGGPHLQIISQPVTRIRRGSLYTYQPRVDNPDQEPVSFFLAESPKNMYIDARTGLLTWIPPPISSSPVDVVLGVRSGQQEHLQHFRIDLTEGSTPPEILSAPPDTAWLDSLYIYPVQARDADGDTLVFQIIAGPEGMRINPLSGVIAWQPEATSSGQVEIELTVYDGQYTTRQAYVIHLLPSTALHSPRIASLKGLALDPGDGSTLLLKLDPLVEDADDPDPLLDWEFELLSGNNLLIDYDPRLRQVRFTAAGNFLEARVRLRVSDPDRLSDERILRVGLRESGDFNSDTAIDLDDFFTLVDAFDSQPGSDAWNANIDLNNDRLIDFDDFFLFIDRFNRYNQPPSGK